jgi:hypothetical protein
MSAPVQSITFVHNYYINYQIEKKARKTTYFNFICDFCETTDTTQPRMGPGGKGTLCNRCGIRWKKEQESLKKMKLEYILNR